MTRPGAIGRAGRTGLLAALALAICALAAPARAERPPAESRYYAPCLDRGPVRLHGRGIKVEAVSSEGREEGAYYVLAAAPGEARGRDGLIPWKELHGVDVWSETPSRAATAGFAAGAALGGGVMLLAVDSPGDFGDFFYAIGVGAVAMATGYIGSRIAAHYAGSARGHWVPCRSIWYPYGSHASLPETPEDAPAASASP